MDKAKERCVFYTFEFSLSARLDLLRLSHSLDELLNHHPVLVSSIAAGQKKKTQDLKSKCIFLNVKNKLWNIARLHIMPMAMLALQLLTLCN